MFNIIDIDNPVSVFTSTGEKLIYHPEVVSRLIKSRKALPVSLQIAPTSICCLKCSFCSNANRNKHESLDIVTIYKVLYGLKKLGLKTVEWTGGGDPTMYEYINEVIAIADFLGLKQGLISNGVLLKEKLTPVSISKLYWIRISMNCLDYVPDIELPKVNGTLGFSYVMNDDTDPNTIKRIKKYVVKYNPSYVRVVPNCHATHEQQEINNAKLRPYVKDLGDPWFFQAKSFKKPGKCFWGYFKPFLLHDGWVYPCSSVVLNDISEKTFHEKFRWFQVDHLMERYNLEVNSFNPIYCDKCVFTNQNDLVSKIISFNRMRDFI